MKVIFNNRNKLNLIIILSLLLSLLSISVASADGLKRTVIEAPDRQGSGAVCDQDPYCEKIDPGTDSGSYTAPGPIVSFSVKAGTNLITFYPPGTSSSELAFCWTVAITGASVTWSRNQTSSTCQDPSHFEIYWEDGNYASATASVQACTTGDETEPVYLSVTGATMNIVGPGIFTYSLPSGQSLTTQNWPVGDYTITYTMDPGVTDPGDLPGSFSIAECSSKENADAEATVEACSAGSETTPVSLSVTGATMTITGPGDFTFTLDPGDTHLGEDWPIGHYTISYELEENYQDPGNLPSGFDIEDCSTKEDAGASATVEACIEGSISTPVVLWVEGATMHITLDGDPTFSMDHSGGPGTYKNLEPGTYRISYTIDENHKDPGTLPSSFVIEECEPEKGFADLSVTVKCIYDPNNTCHRWTITNPNDFAVDFEWSTGSKSVDYSESGSGTVDALGKFVFNTSYVSQTMTVTYSDGEVIQVVTVDSGVCTVEEPDEPAGGSGPSIITTLTPVVLTISGIAIAWILIKHKVKNI